MSTTDNKGSSFLGEVLAIPQVHDLIGSNAESFHAVFSFYSLGTDRLTENQFVSCIKRMNMLCENIPTPAVRQVFYELIEEYKGLERSKSKEPSSPIKSGTMYASSQNPDSTLSGPRTVVKSISFIQFVEAIIRLTYDKFSHLKQYTLCEKLEFIVATRIVPHLDEINSAKQEEEKFISSVNTMSSFASTTLLSMFEKYSSRDARLAAKDRKMTHAGWIKFLKDGMWIGSGVTMLMANNTFTKLSGEAVRSAMVGSSHGTLKIMDFFKAVSMVSHVLFPQAENPIEDICGEIVALKL
ncbi:hypothetical protein RCL1_002649 [Eukaryota sp. TZLM3-RCL]